MSKTVNESVDAEVYAQYKMLETIANIDKELKTTRTHVRNLQTLRSRLLTEAVALGIKRDGSYELIEDTRETTHVDTMALGSMLTQAQFLEIAKVTLEDAAKYLTAEQIQKCNYKVRVTYWKVIEHYVPAGCS